MRNIPTLHDAGPDNLHQMPSWVTVARAETVEEAAFRSGAALAYVGLAVRNGAVPQALWRARLALAAATTCVALSGRRDSAADLRDALHLTRSGDDPGPAGRVLRQWTQAVARPISVAGLGRAIEGLAPEQIALCLDAAEATPPDRAAQVIEAVLTDSPRAETAALILADAVLSQAMGHAHALPLLALSLKLRDLRLRGDDLRLACHRAVVAGAGQVVPLAADLARGAARLQAVVPKLRAKGAERAVALFLVRDALAPSALAREMHSTLSDRAARRLCDRLVDLGALRELTGRDTFRLYGV